MACDVTWVTQPTVEMLIASKKGFQYSSEYCVSPQASMSKSRDCNIYNSSSIPVIIVSCYSSRGGTPSIMVPKCSISTLSHSFHAGASLRWLQHCVTLLCGGDEVADWLDTCHLTTVFSIFVQVNTRASLRVWESGGSPLMLPCLHWRGGKFG